MCGIADLFDPTAVDCGVATLDDDLAAWQAARTCVLQNATDSIAFKAVFDEIGIDSLPRTAYLGLEARSYALSRLRQDIGGVPGVSTVFQAPCAALADVPGCEVSVGEPCIECQDPGDSAAACGP